MQKRRPHPEVSFGSNKFYAGIAQMVERFTCNEDVVGSRPAVGSIFALIAQLVECTLGMGMVASSSLALGSRFSNV